MSREEQFDFYWKEIFTGLAYNPIEFNTYRFDQSMSLPSKFNKLYEMFKQLALNNQEVMDYLKEFAETFDEKLYKSVNDILIKWSEDGVLKELLNKWDDFFEQKYEELEGKYAKEIYNIKKLGVPVTWFEEYYDDVTKHTNMFNEAIKLGSSLNKIIYVPDGEYWVEATDPLHDSTNYLKENNGGIIILDNTTLVMSENVRIHVIPNNDKAYNLINCYNKKNVKIIGGTLVGDRDHPTENRSGEWGYGISIQGGENILIKDVTCVDMWGDGINIQRAVMTTAPLNYYPKNVIVDGVTCDNNRRQGLSLEEGRFIQIKNSVFKNTNGIAPGAGLDVEPAWAYPEYSPICDNIVISNCDFEGNEGSGLLLRGYIVNEQLIVRDIVVKDNYFKNNGVINNFGSGFNSALANNVLFINNILENKQGITVNGNGLIKIYGNTLLDGRIIQDDLFEKKNSEIEIINNDISCNSVDNYYTSCLFFENTYDKLLIDNNVFRVKIPNDIMFFKARGKKECVIRGNSFYGGKAGSFASAEIKAETINNFYSGQSGIPLSTSGSGTNEINVLSNKIYQNNKTVYVGLFKTLNFMGNTIMGNNPENYSVYIEENVGSVINSYDNVNNKNFIFEPINVNVSTSTKPQQLSSSLILTIPSSQRDTNLNNVNIPNGSLLYVNGDDYLKLQSGGRNFKIMLQEGE